MSFIKRFFFYGTFVFIFCMAALILIWAGIIPDISWGAADSVSEGLKSSACAGLVFGLIFAAISRN